MSDMRAFTAQLKRAPDYCNEGTIEQQVEKMEERGHFFEDGIWSESCMQVDGQWWEIENFTDLDAYGFQHAINQGNDIHVTALYYNGGCHWTEIVEEIIKENGSGSDSE